MVQDKSLINWYIIYIWWNKIRPWWDKSLTGPFHAHSYVCIIIYIILL